MAREPSLIPADAVPSLIATVLQSNRVMPLVGQEDIPRCEVGTASHCPGTVHDWLREQQMSSSAAGAEGLSLSWPKHHRPRPNSRGLPCSVWRRYRIDPMLSPPPTTSSSAVQHELNDCDGRGFDIVCTGDRGAGWDAETVRPVRGAVVASWPVKRPRVARTRLYVHALPRGFR